MTQNAASAGPTTLGLQKSFGFGDRLGIATPGHLRAARRYDFAPILAQQSIREMQRTQRTPQDVMQAARDGLNAEKFGGKWGADADHLKTPDDVRITAAAEFCFFTIDPSAHVNNAADSAPVDALQDAVRQMSADGALPADWQEPYRGQAFELDEKFPPLRIGEVDLLRAATKYGRAIAHSASLAWHIAQTMAGKPFEIEISVDETDSPTSVAEHLFFGMELRRRKVPNVVSLAPRFIGDMEKGIDYRGDVTAFERALTQHVAVARFCGPYKISLHSGSDKFSIYPAMGRICGDLLHVKTAGTSYLEALRAVLRLDPDLFGEIAAYCRGRFAIDRASYHISTTDAEVAALPTTFTADAERLYLDERPGRQLMHVTFGSVLTAGACANGRPFKDAIMECLHGGRDLHDELIETHFDKHLRLLSAV